MNFFKNDYLKFGWGNGLYNFDNQDEKFWLTIDKPSRKIFSFKEEVSNTCKNIANKTSKKIYVCFSGGIDSEIICTEFLKNKIDFIPLIVHHDHNNLEDISYAYDWCISNSIEPLSIRCDIISKMNEHDDCLLVYRKFQEFLIDEVEKRNGYCVIGSGEHRYVRTNHQVNLPFYSCIFYVLSYMKQNNIAACPFFFYENSELFHSYSCDAVVKKMITNFNHKYDKYAHDIKKQVYSYYWPNLISREKYHGFEKIDDFRVKWQQDKLQKLGLNYNQIISIPYSNICNWR